MASAAMQPATTIDEPLLRVRAVKTAADRPCGAELNALLRRERAGCVGISLELPGVDLGGARPLCLQEVLNAVETCAFRCKRLDFSSCGLHDESAVVLASFISCQASRMHELDLRDNAFTARGLALICASLARQSRTNVAAPPCWLDFRGNAVARPRDVCKWLVEFGVQICCASKCSRRRCFIQAPVHLAFGLGHQADAVLIEREELRAVLSGGGHLHCKEAGLEAEPECGASNDRAVMQM
mmetsp:Transcript_45892/g.127347  ORF Transcript_45892/g.127347 Transcript_45892/m.127347 type:complete len:241 (-) Transcript_45892:119-841(-)|eukprot:CAMPEP_0117549752 /NCGR_PEP_ID=MMETSP0784-20121206/48329_1 /TAXON_ID=39447 /ORGANISM="" /LENGTH=240 /DNA_ID=CAMNT_0005346753 /DNA_START=123 /DNA_END=845 /DNA_ORIENTATION=+